MQNTKGLTSFGFLLALGLVVSTYLVTDAMRDIRMSHQIIKVRGYAEVQVESDLAIWEITVSAKSTTQEESYAGLVAHRERVMAFLTENGVFPQETAFQSVYVSERKKRDEEGRETNVTEEFRLSQGIEVKSKDVLNLSKLSTAIAALLGEGISLHAGMPRYYYTQVDELKSQLLVNATKDARDRARTIAEGSGVDLGPLRAARQGIFSVRSADSSSISEEGSNDVSSISKKVSAVVTVDYAMR